jgi:hypothetical protein
MISLPLIPVFRLFRVYILAAFSSLPNPDLWKVFSAFSRFLLPHRPARARDIKFLYCLPLHSLLVRFTVSSSLPLFAFSLHQDSQRVLRLLAALLSLAGIRLNSCVSQSFCVFCFPIALRDERGKLLIIKSARGGAAVRVGSEHNFD